jgi:transcriptional regulator with XRE-family HTH domain
MPRKNFRQLREDVLARPGATARVAELRRDLLAEVGLYELRRELKVSQVDLAEQLDVTQSAVSRFEHGVDPRLSTLRDYIEGLGGQLEVRARFDDREVLLSVAEEPASYETDTSDDDDDAPEDGEDRED